MESWKEFTLGEIFSVIRNELGEQGLSDFLEHMIYQWDLPKTYNLTNVVNHFSIMRLQEEIESYFCTEDLITIENRLNGIVSIPYNEWIDARNSEELERVKQGLNEYEMIVYISKTRSKWSMALWNNGKFVEYAGVTKGNEIHPKFIMRINVENFNRDTDSAEVIYKKKTK